MDDKLEFRFAVFEVRQEGDRAIVEGRAMVYGAKANIAGVFTETVEPGAFAGRMNDVVCNYMRSWVEPESMGGEVAGSSPAVAPTS